VSVYSERGAWRYRRVVALPSGDKVRISGTAQINTRRGADDAERAHIERVLGEAIKAKYAPESVKVAAPTLTEWFRGKTGATEYAGRFWTEFVLGEKENREGTREGKRKVFEQPLEPANLALAPGRVERTVGQTRRRHLEEGHLSRYWFWCSVARPSRPLDAAGKQRAPSARPRRDGPQPAAEPQHTAPPLPGAARCHASDRYAR